MYCNYLNNMPKLRASSLSLSLSLSISHSNISLYLLLVLSFSFSLTLLSYCEESLIYQNIGETSAKSCNKLANIDFKSLQNTSCSRILEFPYENGLDFKSFCKKKIMLKQRTQMFSTQVCTFKRTPQKKYTYHAWHLNK